MSNTDQDAQLAAFYALMRSAPMRCEVMIADVTKALFTDGKAFSAIDGGAHVGYHSRGFAELPGCAQVIAVEADPFTIIKLRAAIARLPSADRIVIMEAALQDDPTRGVVRFASSSSHPGRSGVANSVIWQNDTKVIYRDFVEVPATTIDTLSGKAPAPVRMIKLDLEGGEYAALQGGTATMQRDRPLVVLENSVRAPALSGFTPDSFLGFLAGLGYSGFTFGGRPSTPECFFEFHEMWAVPNEQVARYNAAMARGIDQALATP